MKQFTAFWLTGKSELLEGDTVADAFNRAGYSAGALRALDFYSEGDDNSYQWNKVDRTWDKKEKRGTQRSPFGIGS